MIDMKKPPAVGSEGAHRSSSQSDSSAEIYTGQAPGHFNAIADMPRWVTYSLVWNADRNKFDKIPFVGRRRLSTNNTAHWTIMSEALGTAEHEGLSGIGLVMTGGIFLDGHQLIGFDFDDVDLKKFDIPFPTYTERSPSGAGLRMFGWAPVGWAERFKDTMKCRVKHCDHCEVYFGTSPRFLTVTGDVVLDEPIVQLSKEALAVIESWGLNQADRGKAGAADIDMLIDAGQPIALTDLSPDQRHLVDGTGKVDRSAVLHGLVIKLIDSGYSLEDILATLLSSKVLRQYLLDHRNGDPEKAIKFAKEEIGRAYKKSLTCARAVATSTAEAVASSKELVAQHLCTDQKNAARLQKAIGAGVMFAAGRWHVWLGTHWGADKPAALRLTCNLSLLIKLEAEEWEAKPYSSAEEQKLNKDIAASLRKWGAKSEMRERLQAAFSLLEGLVTVPADSLDRDPYALNVMNGTIDLRTGELRPHNQGDLITKCIPIIYDPKAEAPTFKRALTQITDGCQGLATFLQRWFGYCATGDTTEQKFAVHHGDGANGKSLLLGVIDGVLGEYAGTAAPNLLMAGGQNRHPAEIADLFGMRLAVAHEAGENSVLREDLIKQATGGDKLKARRMRENFFEFTPTHTLNLLTNHKPQIRGTDRGIWRRVVLVPYSVTFGTAVEVEQGVAQYLRDDRLGEKLKAEAAGILTWLVQGAYRWYAMGLNPPDVVLQAGAEYRTEQDRAGQFLNEWDKCSAEPMPCDAAYKDYKNWCVESGYHPLGKNKFIEAVEKRPGVTKKVARVVWYRNGAQVACFLGLKK